MPSYNVILRPGYTNQYDVILRDGSITPPNPVPVVSGSVSYLFLFSSLAAGAGDPVISQYYNPPSAINVGCNPDVLVYDLVTGDIDPRWGLMITLPAPIVPALFFHPNLELLVNSPKSLANLSNVIENNLDRPATSYQFLVSGAGPFPFKWF